MWDWRQIFWYNLEWKKAWWFQKGELNFLKFEWDFKINLASLCAAASKFSARYDNNAFDLRIGRVAERQRNLFVTLNDSVFNYVSLTSNIYKVGLGDSEHLGRKSVHYLFFTFCRIIQREGKRKLVTYIFLAAWRSTIWAKVKYFEFFI